jgi:hypothetical protein
VILTFRLTRLHTHTTPLRRSGQQRRSHPALFARAKAPYPTVEQYLAVGRRRRRQATGLARLDRLGRTSATKLIANIQASKTQPLPGS